MHRFNANWFFLVPITNVRHTFLLLVQEEATSCIMLVANLYHWQKIIGLAKKLTHGNYTESVSWFYQLFSPGYMISVRKSRRNFCEWDLARLEQELHNLLDVIPGLLNVWSIRSFNGLSCNLSQLGAFLKLPFHFVGKHLCMYVCTGSVIYWRESVALNANNVPIVYQLKIWTG